MLLPPGVDEVATLSATAARGIGADGLAGHSAGEQPAGLVLGYANLSDAAIERGAQLLAAGVNSVAR